MSILNYQILNNKDMAKTINPDIDMFHTLKAALAAFNKSIVACDLLQSRYGYFLDRSKTALKEWPKQYTLIDTKAANSTEKTLNIV